ncbi:MAG: hypothetical protein EOM62_21400, partial [Bacteroidia bacterium]|nr:hypothetical protein [Bacteroidia bacterium]
DGFIHPNFNLHTVRTFRSSCDEPNLQNMPKHNERQKKILRTGFIPRAPGRQIVEIDLRANEVSCGCSIHHDAQMMSYLSQGEKANMHTDVEKHCYRLSDKEITKELRNSVKGRFVFSSFYGAGAESIARNIWEFITDENPKTGTGVPIRDHMATFGVIDYDSMLLHIEKEYNWFWHELFSGYGKWKEEIWTTYKNQGYLDLPTGFRVVAEMRKTQAMNVIPQGAAFHVLLATFIGLVKRMEYYKLESVVIGQIHDSIVLDVVPQELQMIYNLYLDSQAEVLRRWKWLCFPIVAEADVSKIDGNWADMDEQGPIHKIA